MKLVLKLFGGLFAVLVIAAAALAVQSWYFKPLSINVFFERVFIQFALDDPELLSSLRVLEQFGYDAHNDDLTDASPARAEAQLRKVESDLAMLRSYDRAALSGSQQLSYDVLQWFMVDSVEGGRWMYHNYPVNQLFGVQSETPDFLVQMHQIANAGDAQNYVVRLGKIELKFAQVLEGLRLRESRGIVPPKFVIERVLVGMREFIAKPARDNVLYTHFAEALGKLDKEPQVLRDQLLSDAEAAINSSVYPAYQGLIAYFEGLQPKVTENYGVWKLPDGDAFYDHQVRSYTTTTLGAEEIHQTGLAEVARLELEMDAILKGQGLVDGSLGERIQKLSADPAQLYPNDDAGRAQCLADYQTYIDEISAGLDPYFGIRPKSGVKVERIPVFKEKTAPGAYYNPPALDGSRPGVFFANVRDMAEVPKWGMRTLTYHEAVPGHHFQIAIAQELTGVPTFRKILPFTAYVEGWALYAERLAAELGFQKNPLDDLGRLQAEMFRAVRLVVDTGIHRKRWTREQAIAYMMDKTGMPEGEVVSEIERYFVSPGQALAYKVGMIKLLELRAAAQQQLGERFDMREFHDVVLKDGALPLALLERNVKDWIASRK